MNLFEKPKKTEEMVIKQLKDLIVNFKNLNYIYELTYFIGVYYEMWQKQIRDESEGKIGGENEGSSKSGGDDSKNNETSSNKGHHGH